MSLKKVIFCHQCGALNKASISMLEKQNIATCGKCQVNLKLTQGAPLIQTQQIDKIIRHADLPVVVDIFATWCGPCKIYGPVFEEYAKNHPFKAEFYKLDSEKNIDFSLRYNIRGVPTTLIFHKNRLVQNQSGALSPAQLESLIP